MKKPAITIGVLLILAVGALVYLKTRPSHLEIAQKAENRAAYSEALEEYVHALMEVTENKKLPDKNKAKVLGASEWKNMVADYLTWVGAGTRNINEGYYDATQGIARCTSLVPDQNFMLEYEERPAALDGFKQLWNDAFFPEMVPMPDSHIPLIKKAMAENISVLKISSSRNYTYSGFLLDINAAKRTDFHLYADNSIHLFAEPGTSLLVCKSSATFPSGQVWESLYSIIPVTVPDSSSVVSFRLQTRVNREKRGE
ncbi:MAG: hypothetical protein GF350_00300 [Chitinivibrionales bacterium]|nr:hypothetical protein [Chitinivibrionales bacterium]